MLSSILQTVATETLDVLATDFKLVVSRNKSAIFHVSRLSDADIWEGTHRIHRISFRRSRHNAVYEEQDSSLLTEMVNL